MFVKTVCVSPGSSLNAHEGAVLLGATIRFILVPVLVRISTRLVHPQPLTLVRSVTEANPYIDTVLLHHVPGLVILQRTVDADQVGVRVIVLAP